MPVSPSSTRSRLAFIGRRAPLATLTALARRPTGHAVWLSGIGGIGKSSLLREFEVGLRRRRRAVALVRADLIEPSPGGALRALASELGVRTPPTLRALLARRDRPVLILDAFDATPGLEHWLASEFVRSAARAGMLIVAARTPPSREWLEPHLAARFSSLSLGPFDHAEAATFLRTRGVAVAQRDELARWTGGHPLALALATDAHARGGPPVPSAMASPLVLRSLLDGLVERDLEGWQRSALECLALVPALTEPLLAAMGESGDAARGFAWLRARPYTRELAGGLVVHDLVRDALAGDLWWRASERALAICGRAITYYAERLHRAGARAYEAAAPLAWMFIQQPRVRQTFAAAAPELHLDVMHARDLPALAAIATKHDGPQTTSSVRAAARWQPTAVSVARDAQGTVRGLWIELLIGGDVPAAARRDPLVRAAVAARAALGLGASEQASLQRLQLDRDAGRQLGATIALRVAHDARVLLTTERLRVRWIAAPVGFRWAKVWETRGYRALGLRLHVDDVAFDLWQLDLRGMTTPEYVRAAYLGGGAVELTRARPPDALAAPRGAPVALAELRAALAAVGDPSAFARTALARHPAFVDGVDAWTAWVKRELGALGHGPRGRRWAAAVEATYVSAAAGSQEAVAEQLGLPFRTYRDHLRRGLDELARRLP